MIRLICVPYHLGRFRAGMGAGPDRLLEAGAQERLRSTGHVVEVVHVAMRQPFEHEVGAYFDVQAAVAEQVEQARGDGAFPLILGGNCGCVLGSVAGVGLAVRGGVVWLDAHGDANTPETTESGFLDGMPVAVLTGRCWVNLAGTIPGFTALPADRILLAGVRSIDQQEQLLIDTAGIPLVGPAGLTGRPDDEFAQAISRLAQVVDSVHVHVDLDVIDTADGIANEFAADHGPRLDALAASLEGIGSHVSVNSISLTSFNPQVDVDGRALASALHLLDSLSTLVPAA